MSDKFSTEFTDVRGGGNVLPLHPKTDYDLYHAELDSATETVNGVSETVFSLGYYNLYDAVVLSADSSMFVGTTYTLTATVKDSAGEGSGSGLTVSFYEGTNLLGTGTTNSSGVATYSYTPNSKGAKSLTAKYDTLTSTEVSVIVKIIDSVTLATDKQILSQYDSESATLTATVLDDSNNPISDVTVDVLLENVVFSSGTTNSDGEFTCTYTATAAGEKSFVANVGGVYGKYSSIIQIKDCIYADSGATDKSSNYTSRYLEGSGTASLTHRTSDYDLTNGSSGSKVVVVNDLALTDFTMEVDVYPVSGSIGLAISTAVKYGDVYSIPTGRNEIYGWRYINGGFSTPIGTSYLSSTLTDYNAHIQLIKEGSSLTIKVFNNANGNQVYSKSITLHSNFTGDVNVGLGLGGSNEGYFKNLVIY